MRAGGQGAEGVRLGPAPWELLQTSELLDEELKKFAAIFAR